MPATDPFSQLIFGIRSVGGETMLSIGETLTFRIEGFSRRIGNKSDIGYTNRTLAEKMHNAVLDKYDEQTFGNPHSGRTSNRLAGKLRPALAKRSNVVSAKGQQIRMINVPRLDAEAAHWARMNFGVTESSNRRAIGPGSEGIRPTRSPKISVNIDFFGEIGKESVRLPFGPSDPYSLPKGFFQDDNGKGKFHDPRRRGQDQFFPGNVGKRVGTRGQKPGRFLEAGLRSFAKNVGPAYKKQIQDWFDTPTRPNISITKIN